MENRLALRIRELPSKALDEARIDLVPQANM